jgi:hypothetical protein
MPDVFDVLTQLVGERPSWTFAAILVMHVAAGLTAVVSGATAMLSPKRNGRHPKAGRTYYAALCVVCATAVGMAAMRWPEDAYLVVLGTLSLAAASVGYLARHHRWQGWIRIHILGMATSYIVLMTAFYVDNGPRVPVWDRLPWLAFWIVPGVIGFPLVARALVRHSAGLRAPPVRTIERIAALWSSRFACNHAFDDAELGALAEPNNKALGLDGEQWAPQEMLFSQRDGDPFDQPLDSSRPCGGNSYVVK